MASARSKARKRALEALYAAELRGADPRDVLAEKEAVAETPLNPYARVLVEGVVSFRDRIDQQLETHAEGWSLERMPVVDRNVLRIGVYELLWGTDSDVPEPVAVSEAVALVKELSTDASPGFVNGLLGRIQQLKPQLVAAARSESDADQAADTGASEDPAGTSATRT